MKQIISASRRTDIPQFYAKWFEHRLRDGVVAFRNVFGGKGQASLKPEDVAGFLFWSKYAKPFHGILEMLRSARTPYAFQYTITGMGGLPIEPNIPKPSTAIDDFLTIRQGLPSSRAIQWRYDPIVLTDECHASYHLKKFAEIAKALQGATKVVNVSFVEPYAKSIRRLKHDESICFRPVDPKKHKSVMRYQDQIHHIYPSQGKPFLQELASCARMYGMELRACCNPEFEITASQCISHEMFLDYDTDPIDTLKQRPSRSDCQCLSTIDIGMDNTCMGGCQYCYVVVSQKTASRNFQAHDPKATMLRPKKANGADGIVKRC